MTRKEAASLEELMASSWLYRFRKVVRFVPRSPRCKVCNVPFAGPGRAFKLAGLGPSRKNPNMCTTCFERAPVGGTELEIGVLFADVRGFTALAEDAAPEEVAARLAPFYKAARSVLIRHDAIIDKLVGDEVMALFIPTFIGEAAVESWSRPGSSCSRTSARRCPSAPGPTSALPTWAMSVRRTSRTSPPSATSSTRPRAYRPRPKRASSSSRNGSSIGFATGFPPPSTAISS
jgi:hypothetical protein